MGLDADNHLLSDGSPSTHRLIFQDAKTALSVPEKHALVLSAWEKAVMSSTVEVN